MAVPIDFYDCTAIWAVDGSAKEFTWSIGATTLIAPGTETPLQVAESFYGMCTEEGSVADPQYVVSSYRFLGVSVSMMTSTGPLVAQVIDAVRGTSSNGALPPNCAVLITKNTAAGGRRNKGRLYAPPTIPGENLVDPVGNLFPSDLPAVQGTYDVLFAGFATAGLTPVLFHQSGDQEPTEITSLLVNSRLATQRRRMR